MLKRIKNNLGIASLVSGSYICIYKVPLWIDMPGNYSYRSSMGSCSRYRSSVCTRGNQIQSGARLQGMDKYMWQKHAVVSCNYQKYISHLLLHNKYSQFKILSKNHKDLLSHSICGSRASMAELGPLAQNLSQGVNQVLSKLQSVVSRLSQTGGRFACKVTHKAVGRIQFLVLLG